MLDHRPPSNSPSILAVRSPRAAATWPSPARDNHLPLAHRAVQVAKNHRLRGSDAVYVSVAETFNSKLIAWDAEMLARGTDVVTTMTPLEWMKEEAVTG